MYCSASKDQPLRVQASKNGVVHAASYQNYGGFTRTSYTKGNRNGESEFVPKQKRLRLACRWTTPPNLERFLVPNTTNITCKNCMAKMGMKEGPISPKRYVVRNIKTGEFMKNTASRCSGWSESLTDAFFFRTEHTALDKCKVGRHKVGDELLTYSEWSKRNTEARKAVGRPNNDIRTSIRYEYVRIFDPNLEIRPVKFTLED